MLPAWWQVLRATDLRVMGSWLVKGPVQGLGEKVCVDSCGDNTGEGQERGCTRGERALTKQRAALLVPTLLFTPRNTDLQMPTIHFTCLNHETQLNVSAVPLCCLQTAKF